MVWGWFVQWPRASPSRTEFLHKLLVAKTGCFSDWSYVIYCLFCFRTILKFVPIICMLSSSQDQLSLAPGAPIREGTRIKLILTCRLWGLWLVLSAASYTWATPSKGCPRSCFSQAMLYHSRGGWALSPARIKWPMDEAERAVAQGLETHVYSSMYEFSLVLRRKCS